MQKRGEPLYELPTDLVELEAVRGSIFVLDWAWLRENAVYDEYATRVSPKLRDALFGVSASAWIPVAIAHEHYRALDGLMLSEVDLANVGKSVGDRVHGAVIQTLVRLAGQLGATPWLALGQSQKLWARSWLGGGIAVYRQSERVARVEILKTSVSSSRFYRGSFGGAITGGIAPFCRASTLREDESARTPASFALDVSWVPR